MIQDYTVGMDRDGLIRGMPEDVYHHGGPDNECSVHLAMTMMEFTPWHARYAIEHPDTTDTDAKRFGRCVHARLLQPEQYDSMVTVMPEGKTRHKSKWWTEFQEEHEGTDIISYDQGIALDDIELAVRKHGLASQVLDDDGLETELSGFFTDPDSGVRCRLRLDAHSPSFSVHLDLKTGYDLRKRKLERSFGYYNYPMQQAWYEDGLALLGLPAEYFLFLCIESKVPHAVRLVTCAMKDVHRARALNAEARQRWSGHARDGEWPSWEEEIEVIEVSPYAWNFHEEI